MSKISAEIIEKLDNKIHCISCKRIIFEGIIERGAINHKCNSCGCDNVIIALGNQNERFYRNNRSKINAVSEYAARR
jgi:hypothetical protein